VGLNKAHTSKSSGMGMQKYHIALVQNIGERKFVGLSSLAKFFLPNICPPKVVSGINLLNFFPIMVCALQYI